MKTFRLNSNNWQAVFLLIIIVAFSIIIISVLRQPTTVENINLKNIIDVPREFKTHNSDWHCQFGLADIADVTQPDDLPKLGILSKVEQLKQETISNGCYRASIAIYSDTHAANTAYYTLQEVNRTFTAKTTSYDLGEETIIVATPWEFQTTLSNASFEKMQIQSRLLIMHQCNTVITFLVFIRQSDEAFGLPIDDNDIVSYAEKIDERVEKKVCPIVTVDK